MSPHVLQIFRPVAPCLEEVSAVGLLQGDSSRCRRTLKGIDRGGVQQLRVLVKEFVYMQGYKVCIELIAANTFIGYKERL